MTKEQIENMMYMPISQLKEIAQTQEGFIDVLSCAINFGIAEGIRRVTENTNKALREYRIDAIKN